MHGGRFRILMIYSVLGGSVLASAESPHPETPARTPLIFEVNRGQSDPQVEFLARRTGSIVFLTPREAVVHMLVGPTSETEPRTPPQPAVLRVRWGTHERTAQLVGQIPLATRSHYFTGAGNDRERWLTDVETFGSVVAQEAYQGIDIVFRDRDGLLELEFDVAPGIDPRVIDLEIQGADSIHIDERGAAVLSVAGSDVRLAPPHLFQPSEQGNETVSGAYVVRRGNRLGFRVGTYDDTRMLVIDPVLHYSTYLGGAGLDFAHAIAVDDHGHAYVAGQTISPNFPASTAFATPGARFVAYVTKFDPSGSRIIFTSFLGATDPFSVDNLRLDKMGVAVDGAGFVYVAGDTSDPTFPTVHALQPQIGGKHDGFVAKLSPSGTTLVFSTFLGGANDDWARDLALGADNSVSVIGTTQSTDFPTHNALQSTKSGERDAFVLKLQPSGSALVYATYLGGNDQGAGGGYGDFGSAIAVDAAGNAYATGLTTSANFPVTAAVQPALGGGDNDAYVAKLNADGSALVYASFLGGTQKDEGLGIAVDGAGAAYVTGWTSSTDFPVVSAAQAFNAGGADGFVTKLAPDGQTMLYSTYLGGSGIEIGWDIAVSHDAAAHVVGTTGSSNFPLASPVQPGFGGGPTDAFVTRLAADGSLISFSSFLGGSGEENLLVTSVGIALSRSSIYVSGNTVSANFPVASPAQSTAAGMIDGFVTKIGTAPEILLRIEPVGNDNVLSVVLSNGSVESKRVQLKLWTSYDGGAASILPSAFVLNLAPGEVREFPATTLPAIVSFPGSLVGGRLLDPITGAVLSEQICSRAPCE